MKHELEKVRLELEGEKAKGKALEDQIDGMQQIEDLDILMESDINCGGFELLEDMLQQRKKKKRIELRARGKALESSALSSWN